MKHFDQGSDVDMFLAMVVWVREWQLVLVRFEGQS